jgi:hypothetical protein
MQTLNTSQFRAIPTPRRTTQNLNTGSHTAAPIRASCEDVIGERDDDEEEDADEDDDRDYSL